jgi:diguanylate cyclase (GGDEF)-like protein/PAS domain S-box-containing protein
MDLFTSQITADPVLEYWGWSSTASAPETFVNNLKYIWLLIIGLAGLYLILRFYLKQDDPIEKKQSGFVAIGVCIPLVLGLFGEILLPILGHKLPELTDVAFAFGTGGFIGYAIWRYELFALTPADAADKIIATMSDSLLLVDPQGNVITANQTTLDLLGYQKEELIGRPVDMVFAEGLPDGALHEKEGTDAANEALLDMESSLKTKDKKQIPISLSSSVLHDKFGRSLGSILIARDITERKITDRALRESESRLQIIMEAVQTGIIIIDPDTHTIVEVNSRAASMIGAPREEIVGSVCHKFICPAEVGKCPITDLHQNVDHSERVLLSATGETCPILKSVTTVDLNGKENLLESFTDITERKRMEEELKASLAEKDLLVKTLDEYATHDALTGLYNHRAFYMLLDEEFERAKRFKRPIALLMLDIDHFKQVNDKHGHLAGDAVLNAISAILVRRVRAIDRVCRYGGEEITVILPEADAEAAADTAERLRRAVEEQQFDTITAPRLHITVSIGVASSPADADSLETLVGAADMAMFVAKERGRNQIVLYEQIAGRSNNNVA